MTETLTGKQVLALLAQDEPPEIEQHQSTTGLWLPLQRWFSEELRMTTTRFRIKPTPQRRLSVTLANGEVVSWPEPVRDELEDGQEFWYVDYCGWVSRSIWAGDNLDARFLAFGNTHLTREAAQEHADALRKINTQGVSDALD